MEDFGDGCVDDDQEPRRQKSVVAIESMLRKRIDAAGIGLLVHHAMVAIGDDRHQSAAERNADDAAQKARFGEAIAAGDDERAPADGGSNG